MEDGVHWFGHHYHPDPHILLEKLAPANFRHHPHRRVFICSGDGGRCPDQTQIAEDAAMLFVAIR